MHCSTRGSEFIQRNFCVLFIYLWPLLDIHINIFLFCVYWTTVVSTSIFHKIIFTVIKQSKWAYFTHPTQQIHPLIYYGTSILHFHLLPTAPITRRGTTYSTTTDLFYFFYFFLIIFKIIIIKKIIMPEGHVLPYLFM